MASEAAAHETQDNRAEHDEIVLGLLQSVERNGAQSQRDLASELGIALGLVNSYLKRCVNKGLLKVQEVPARRYAYYLTPQGFAEKSRLTASYFAHSFSFFRRARADCETVLADAASRNFKRIVLAGASDLAEIMTLCARDYPLTLVAIVDPAAERKKFAGLSVVHDFSEVEGIDAVMITSIDAPDVAQEAAVAAVGTTRVLVPELLKLKLRRAAENASSRAAAGGTQ
jgi:DNA-binding MarR family transcriptional regulator